MGFLMVKLFKTQNGQRKMKNSILQDNSLHSGSKFKDFRTYIRLTNSLRLTLSQYIQAVKEEKQTRKNLTKPAISDSQDNANMLSQKNILQ